MSRNFAARASRHDGIDDLIRQSLRHHGPATVPQLVERLGIHTDFVRRALRLLDSEGIAERDPCDLWRIRRGR